jgi:hypothetical protein
MSLVIGVSKLSIAPSSNIPARYVTYTSASTLLVVRQKQRQCLTSATAVQQPLYLVKVTACNHLAAAERATSVKMSIT